jgi:hypothetical protein
MAHWSFERALLVGWIVPLCLNCISSPDVAGGYPLKGKNFPGFGIEMEK